MTDITAYETAPQRQFTADDGHHGPVLADITCPDGAVRVTVDPAATVATVRVSTDDPTGPAAKAVRETRIHQADGRLTIVVPPIPPTTGQFNRGGGVFIQGSNYGSVISGGTMTVNGIVVSGMNGVEVLVTLPAGSGVQSRSENGSLHTHGDLAALSATAANGSIQAESVGRIQASAANGSIKVGTVTEWIDADSSNGSVRVDHHAGHTAQVRSGNGSVHLTAAPGATGSITATTGNGTVRLHGVRHRTDLHVTATAGNGTVKKY